MKFQFRNILHQRGAEEKTIDLAQFMMDNASRWRTRESIVKALNWQGDGSKAGWFSGYISFHYHALQADAYMREFGYCISGGDGDFENYRLIRLDGLA